MLTVSIVNLSAHISRGMNRPEAAPPSPGTPLIEPDMEPDMLPEPDVTDEEQGAMEELDEGLEDELPELPQQPANSAATSTSARVRTKVFFADLAFQSQLLTISR